MMRKMVLVGMTAGLLSVASIAGAAEDRAPAPTPQQASVQAGALEVLANQQFQASEYAKALPMYRKLAEMVKGDPEKLGPIEEKIRVCEKNIARKAREQGGAAAVATTPNVTAVPIPTGPATSAEQRKPHTAPKAGGTLELSIKELGNFDYDQEKGGNIPKDVKQLSGTPVRLRGFMIPMDQADNITKFALVPDLFACCFGQPPQIQHMVVASCPDGKAVSYSPDEIVVEGKLNVEEKKDDGYIISIFEVAVSSVKAAPR
jgi:hypothetical protein